jgi:putative ABC transport system substrate-binding protein
MRRIGVLMAHAESDTEFKAYVAVFRSGLEKLGWSEGRNIRIDFRWGALDDADARQLSAKQLIALEPELILTQNTPPTASMLQQTRTIPVVFVIVADPVGSGFVESLARPGGNATGFTVMEPTISGKWVELLKEIAPRVNRVAVLFNPATTPYANIYLNPFKAAAASFGLEAIDAPVHSVSDLEFVIVEQGRAPNGSLVVIPDGFLNVHRTEIVSLAARHHVPAAYPWRFFPEIGGLLSYGSDQVDLFRLAATYVDRTAGSLGGPVVNQPTATPIAGHAVPAIFQYREFAAAGGLMSYGSSFSDSYRQVGIYTGRILKGEKPADLPVQQAIKAELIINLKTAKALGLTFSLTLLGRADEVIE